MSRPRGTPGFEPRSSPPERRAQFDLIRQIEQLKREIQDLKDRVAALEP